MRWILLAGVGLALAACAHKQVYEIEGRGFVRIFTPQMPNFIIGPAGAILTNAAGYSARVTVSADPALQLDKPVDGELLCRGSKLLFAPRGVEKAENDAPAKGFVYVWDEATSSGHIRSEALQGYAPVSTPMRATNVSSASLGPNSCEITVLMNDGSKTVFQISGQVTSIGAVPPQLKALGNPPLVLTVSKIRMQAPPEETFSIPDGFAKYATPEALADELAARQHNLRRGAPLLPSVENMPKPAPR